MTEGMGRLRRTGVIDTYILLLALTLLGSYMILFNPAPKEQSRLEKDLALDRAELERQIEDTRDRIFHISYYPVFEKHYHRFFTDPPNKKANGLLDKSYDEGGSKRVSQHTLHYHQIWLAADANINRDQLFPDSRLADKVLRSLANARIVNVDLLDIGDYESGTADKWVVALEGGQKAVVKLIWEEKGQMKADAQCNFGYEMPWSEIAAFHLHRILGFRNTPYVSGRKINLRTEILPVASPAVMKQIQIMKDKKICVVGKCYHCKTEDHLCPDDDVVEASMSYWIPRHLKLYTWWPLYMPFSTPRMEEWKHYGFNNKSYCNKVRKTVEPYEQRQFYLDLFDFAILDTLMYHFDSKHYAVDDNSSARGATIRLDHGRAFCAHDRDEYELFLAPLIQCCTLRKTTYEKLLTFTSPGTLSRRFKEENNKDPLAPVLEDSWYSAIDRRLQVILNTVEKCAKANGGLHNVLV